MKFKFLFAVAALGLLAAGCSNETDPNAPANGPVEGVYLTISMENDGATRAGAEDSHEASTAESSLKSMDIKVAVYNQGGNWVNAQEMTLEAVAGETNKYKTTNTITVTAGNLFYFVFANDEKDLITLPTGGIMEAFVEEVLAAGYNAAGNPANVATDGEFLLGSLWKETDITAAGGTQTAPKNVDLTIGRLASKVLVKAFADVNTTGMKGTFTTPAYRLGSLAKAITWVGDNEAANKLPYTKGVLVTSANHTTAPIKADSTFNDVDYLQYSSTSFTALNSLTANTVSSYLTENTTALDADGVQYYGNTSYIQIQTKYTPVLSEVYAVVADGDGWKVEAMGNEFTPYAGGTFYAGYYDNQRLLFAVNPTTSAIGDEFIDVVEYTSGLNYHKFVIYDKGEEKSTVETRNRVLRNHYYEYGITDLKDLGSHTSDVDPLEPVPAETIVELTVTVKKWDKVADENVIL